jgi:hypothetical protein
MMKRPSSSLRAEVLLGVVLSLIAGAVGSAKAPEAALLFVSPMGDDTGDGSAAHPFLTLERARDAVRALKAAGGLPVGGITVSVSPGRYQRRTSFILGSQDGGSEEAPVVWKAAGPGKVVLDAGIRVRASDFTQPVEEDLRRVDPGAEGKVVSLDLASLGIQHGGPYPVSFDNGGGLLELYLDGERQPLSRWPNEGSAKIERIVDKGESAPGQFKGKGRFVAREERVSRWPVEQGVWVEGYWRVPWDVRAVKVEGIDPASREVTLGAPVAGGIGSKYAGAQGSGAEPWWAINLLEEIDRPGEWCVDFQTRRLHWWPAAGKGNGEAVAILADMAEPLVLVEKAAHVRIEGFCLENGLSHAIELRDSHGVEVAGCRIRNVAGSGVVVSRGEGNTVRSCEISATGHSGIVLSGGNRATLTPCWNTAENNHIQKVGVLKKTYAPGILVGIYGAGDAVGCRVAHNFIHDVPHGGIQYGGNDHVFEYNEISHAVLTSDDMGAFYTTNDWTSCGNVLRYNFVHHSPNAVGFYMDDGDGGDTLYGNIACEMQAGFAVCGGHYNSVRNNIAFRCKRGLFLDARGVARVYDKTSSLNRKLLAVPFLSEPWSSRFPYFKGLSESDTRLPQGNLISENVTAQCEKAARISAKPEEIKDSVFARNLDLEARDPKFAAPATGDYSLAPDSPVFSELPSFEKIPFHGIGLYRDEYRRELPPRQIQAPEAPPSGSH